MIPPIVVKSSNKTKVYCIDVTANENGETSISFPDDMGLLKYWKSGDKTYWIDHGNGNWSVYMHREEEEDNATEA